MHIKNLRLILFTFISYAILTTHITSNAIDLKSISVMGKSIIDQWNETLDKDWLLQETLNKISEQNPQNFNKVMAEFKTFISNNSKSLFTTETWLKVTIPHAEKSYINKIKELASTGVARFSKRDLFSIGIVVSAH
jgi:hypothetical protein